MAAEITLVINDDDDGMRCKHIVAYILFLSNAVHKHSFYIHHFCFCILPFFSQENMSFFLVVSCSVHFKDYAEASMLQM